MEQLKFVNTWAKVRNRGAMLYIFRCIVIIITSSLFGKIIGDYFVSKTIIKAFRWQDYVGLILIFFISTLIGILLWKRNERKYKELVDNTETNR